jgi:hypothetical protein
VGTQNIPVLLQRFIANEGQAVKRSLEDRRAYGGGPYSAGISLLEAGEIESRGCSKREYLKTRRKPMREASDQRSVLARSRLFLF